MSNIISSGLKSVVTIKQFVEKKRGLKFSGVKGEKHIAYYPERPDGKDALALLFNVHEVVGFDGKKKAFVCTKDMVNEVPQLDAEGKPVLDDKGEPVMVIDSKLDGTCPICDRVEDSGEVYNHKLEAYKMRVREAKPDITEEELNAIIGTKNGVRAHYAQQRVASRAVPQVYTVILTAKATGDRENPIELREGGVPDIKIGVRSMLGRSRQEGSLAYPEKLVKGLIDAEDTKAESDSSYEPREILHFGGAEVTYDYPNVEEYMTMMKTAYDTHKVKLLGSGYFTNRAEVVAEAKRVLDEFDMESMKEAFPELKDTNVKTMRAMLNQYFSGYDAWKKNGRIGVLNTGMEEFPVPMIETRGNTTATTSGVIPMEGEVIEVIIPQLVQKETKKAVAKQVGSTAQPVVQAGKVVDSSDLDFDGLDENYDF
jgi:hypothetical protein